MPNSTKPLPQPMPTFHPVKMPECADIESGLKRCCWHRFNSDSVLAHSGMFIGQLHP